MKPLGATAILLMAVAVFAMAHFTSATAESALQGPLQVAGWFNPAIAPKERNYSIPVQNSDRCACSGERGCISRIQCLDTGGTCHRDC